LVHKDELKKKEPKLIVQITNVHVSGSRKDVVQVGGSREDVVQVSGSREDVVQVGGSRVVQVSGSTEDGRLEYWV
jgi:hypothetical protein